MAMLGEWSSHVFTAARLSATFHRCIPQTSRSFYIFMPQLPCECCGPQKLLGLQKDTDQSCWITISLLMTDIHHCLRGCPRFTRLSVSREGFGFSVLAVGFQLIFSVSEWGGQTFSWIMKRKQKQLIIIYQEGGEKQRTFCRKYLLMG